MTEKASKSSTEVAAPKSSPPAESQIPTVPNEPVVDTQARPAMPESTSTNRSRPSNASPVEIESTQPIPESISQDARKESVPAAKSTPEQSPESQDTMTTKNEPSQAAPSAQSTPVQGSTESAVLIVPSVPSPVLDALPEKSLLIDIPPSTQELQPAPASDEPALGKPDDSSKVDASSQEPTTAGLSETDSPAQKENVTEPVPLVSSPEPTLRSDKTPSDTGLPKDDRLEEVSPKENPLTKSSSKEVKDDTHTLPSPITDSSSDELLTEKENDMATGPLSSRAASIPGEFPPDEIEHNDSALPQPPNHEEESRQNQDVKEDVENGTPHAKSALVAATEVPSIDMSAKDTEGVPKESVSKTVPTVTPPVDSMPRRDTHDSVVPLPAPIPETTMSPPNNEIPKNEAEHTGSASASHSTPEPVVPPVHNTDVEVEDAPKVPPSSPPADAAVLPVENPLEQTKTTIDNGLLDSAPEASVLPNDKEPSQGMKNSTPGIQPIPAPEPIVSPTKILTCENSKGSDVATSPIENSSEEKDASKRTSPSLAAQTVSLPTEQSSDKELAAGPEAGSTLVPEIAPSSPEQSSNEVVLPSADSESGPPPDSSLPAAEDPSIKSRGNSTTSAPAPIPSADESTPKATGSSNPVEPHSQPAPRNSNVDSMPSIKEESPDNPKDVTDHKSSPPASGSPADKSPNEVNNIVRTPPADNIPEVTADSIDHSLPDVAWTPVVRPAEDPTPQKQSEIQPDAVTRAANTDFPIVEPTAIEPTANGQVLPQAQVRQPSKFSSASPPRLRAAAMTSTTSVPLPPAPQSSPKLPTASDKAIEPLEAVANSPPDMRSIEEVIASPTLPGTPPTILPKPDLALPTNASLPDQVSKRRRVVQVARELVARRRMLVLLLGHELGNATHAQLRHVPSTLAQVPVHG